MQLCVGSIKHIRKENEKKRKEKKRKTLQSTKQWARKAVGVHVESEMQYKRGFLRM
jgi:hypothetical protein